MNIDLHNLAWGLTPWFVRANPHAMENYRTAIFVHPRFQPGDLERIVGLTPVAVRDWRRRGLIHPSLEKEKGGFHLSTLADLLLLKRLSDHGIGPKQVYGWTNSYSRHIFWHALADRSAWASDEAWELWQQKLPVDFGERYFVIRTAPGGYGMTDDPSGEMARSKGVVTFVDCEALGCHLREAAAPRVSDFVWRNFHADENVVRVTITNPNGIPLGRATDDDIGELVG